MGDGAVAAQSCRTGEVKISEGMVRRASGWAMGGAIAGQAGVCRGGALRRLVGRGSHLRSLCRQPGVVKPRPLH